jgi:UDP-N-acetylglucosamine 2-epimerase
VKARDFLIDEGLSNVMIVEIGKTNHSLFEGLNTKEKKKEKIEYTVYEIIYKCSNFRTHRQYKIRCEKLDQYISHRIRKIKEIFENDSDFTISR